MIKSRMNSLSNPNARQIEFWNGPAGKEWSLNQARIDLAFAPLTKALIEAAKPRAGETIIEIGCGCGDLSLALSPPLGPDGKILGLDVSTPMLARAKARACEAAAPHLAQTEFISADATDYAFDPIGDLIISRFGVMFFADPLAAFKNIGRGLKPGGRLAILCWCSLEENFWVTHLFDAVSDLAPKPEPALPAAASFEEPGPYAFANQQRICGLLEKAGFTQVRARRITAELQLGEAPAEARDKNSAAVEDALVLALQLGPIGALMRNADPDLQVLIKQRVQSRLANCVTNGRIELEAACWLYEAEIQKLQ
jgi:ubiquinone/menaquinone biosynthesis C-methylase UbiE